MIAVIFTLSVMYTSMFHMAPLLWGNFMVVPPLDKTRGFVNVQTLSDLLHVGIITSMVISRFDVFIPHAVFVYFIMDIYFYFESFLRFKWYLLHHICGCFLIFIVLVYMQKDTRMLSCVVWIQETALIPIQLVQLFRVNSIDPPPNLLVARALWYFLSRVTSFGYIMMTHKKLWLLCAPLMIHNIHVFKLQVLAFSKQMT